MIRILITEAAFAAIGGGDPDAQRESGAQRYGHAPKGFLPIWLAPEVVEGLARQRGPGESYSDVILRM
jgi:hypothetical protein